MAGLGRLKDIWSHKYQMKLNDPLVDLGYENKNLWGTFR